MSKMSMALTLNLHDNIFRGYFGYFTNQNFKSRLINSCFFFLNALYDILITKCDNKQLPSTFNNLEVMFYALAMGRNLPRVFYLLSVNLALHWFKKKDTSNNWKLNM